MSLSEQTVLHLILFIGEFGVPGSEDPDQRLQVGEKGYLIYPILNFHSLFGRQLNMTEILLTGLININSNSKYGTCS